MANNISRYTDGAPVETAREPIVLGGGDFVPCPLMVAGYSVFGSESLLQSRG